MLDTFHRVLVVAIVIGTVAAAGVMAGSGSTGTSVQEGPVHVEITGAEAGELALEDVEFEETTVQMDDGDDGARDAIKSMFDMMEWETMDVEGVEMDTVDVDTEAGTITMSGTVDRIVLTEVSIPDMEFTLDEESSAEGMTVMTAVQQRLAESGITVGHVTASDLTVESMTIEPMEATPTATATPTETATETATPTATETATPTATETATPTETDAATDTMTGTETMTGTDNGTETGTPSPTATGEASQTLNAGATTGLLIVTLLAGLVGLVASVHRRQ